MNFKAFCLSAALIAGFAAPQGIAQSDFEVGGLGAIDSWNTSWIRSEDGALPQSLWRGSDADFLLTLFGAVAGADDLSPAAADLRRAIILSGGTRPSIGDADALLAARVDLLLEIGALEAAVDLMGQSPAARRDKSVDLYRAELALLQGNVATACRGVQSGQPTGDGSFRLLQATCFALAGNVPSAELALEFARESGITDPWYAGAIAALGDEDGASGPPARFEDGLTAALSIAGGLKTGDGSSVTLSPGAAAELLKRRDLGAGVRAALADIAGAAGLVSALDHLRAYEALLGSDDAGEGALQTAIEVFGSPEASAEDKIDAMVAALKEDGISASDVRLRARVLSPYLSRLPRTAETAPRALDLAILGVLGDDLPRAALWRQWADYERGEASEGLAFRKAYVDALLIVSGQDRSPASVGAVTTALIDASQGERTRVAELLVYLSALDLPLSSEARAFLLDLPSKGNRTGLDSWKLAASLHAFRSGSIGEGALGVVTLVDAPLSRIDPNDVAAMVSALRRGGMSPHARAFVLEALTPESLLSQ